MAVGGYLVLLAMMFMGLANVYFLLIPGFFVFAAFGMLTVLTTVFLANTVDYGELKTIAGMRASPFPCRPSW